MRSDRGATAIEYALIIALVGVIIFAGVTLLGGRLSSVFTSAANGLGGLTGGGGGGGGAADPCAAKTASGSPAPTCAASGGVAVWTCPTGTLNEGASTVTCTAALSNPGAPTSFNAGASGSNGYSASWAPPSNTGGATTLTYLFGYRMWTRSGGSGGANPTGCSSSSGGSWGSWTSGSTAMGLTRSGTLTDDYFCFRVAAQNSANATYTSSYVEDFAGEL